MTEDIQRLCKSDQAMLKVLRYARKLKEIEFIQTVFLCCY